MLINETRKAAEYIKELKGSGGTSDYNELTNKPTINGVEVEGTLTTTDLKLAEPQEDIILEGDVSWLLGGTVTFEDAEDIAKLEHFKELLLADKHPRFGFTLTIDESVSTAVKEVDYVYTDTSMFMVCFTAFFSTNGLLGITIGKSSDTWTMSIVQLAAYPNQ